MITYYLLRSEIVTRIPLSGLSRADRAALLSDLLRIYAPTGNDAYYAAADTILEVLEPVTKTCRANAGPE